MRRYRVPTIVACLLALGAMLALSACSLGDRSKEGRDAPAREGLAIPMAGVNYNVFLTRELNLKIEEDKGYYHGPPAPPGNSLYAVFLQACNNTDHPVRTSDDFYVEDNQGHRFYPVKVQRPNPFAYYSRLLNADECAPAVGSVAQLGPTAALFVLFKFPLQNTENRPLLLTIRGPYDLLKGKYQKLTFLLDI
jgi:hypothetical protein